MPNTQSGLLKAVFSLGLATMVASGPHLLAQNAPIPFVDPAPTSSTMVAVKSRVVGVSLLSDTQGVNFDPYFRSVIETLSPNLGAAKTVTASADAPTTLLTVTIRRDGKVVGLHLGQSSKNIELNRAAWASVSQHTSLPPLPKSFVGSSIVLQVRIQAS